MKDKDSKKDEEKNERRIGRRFLAGVIVIIVGLGLLLQNMFSWFSFNYVVPVIIIVVGISLIMRGSR